MKYLEIFNAFKERGIFSLKELKLREKDFNLVQLNQWQKKGYLIKLTKGYYLLSELRNEIDSMFVANFLYYPSYLSLESALFYYQFIPDVVFNETSITTRKTRTIRTPLGDFLYFSLQPKLFFGYEVRENKAGQKIKIAEREKAILDFFYLRKDFKKLADIEEMRFNCKEIQEQIRPKVFLRYAKKFNKRVQYLAQIFLKYCQENA